MTLTSYFLYKRINLQSEFLDFLKTKITLREYYYDYSEIYFNPIKLQSKLLNITTSVPEHFENF